MFRTALTKTGASLQPFSTPIARRFTTKSPPNCKACVGQILEQAQSALPTAYKTVKTAPHSSNDALRRDQLIWLLKHSQGKEVGAENKEPSRHERPWDASQRQDDGAGGHASWEGPTGWPHMWLSSRRCCQAIANEIAGEGIGPSTFCY